jgi:hypothetical protein
VDGCRATVKSKKGIFQIKTRKNPNRNRMLFRLAKVEETALADLGDPLTTTRYSVCIYDESGDTPGLIAEFNVEPGGQCLNRKGTKARPCWKKAGQKFKYRDPQRTNDGMLALRVKAGARGKGKVVVVARGANIPTVPLPLNVDSKVIVQMINDAAPAPNQNCWGAEFREPVNKNRKDWFRDRTD